MPKESVWEYVGRKPKNGQKLNRIPTYSHKIMRQGRYSKSGNTQGLAKRKYRSAWVVLVSTAYPFSVPVRQSRSNLSFDPRTTSMFEVEIDGFVASMGLNIAS